MPPSAFVPSPCHSICAYAILLLNPAPRGPLDMPRSPRLPRSLSHDVITHTSWPRSDTEHITYTRAATDTQASRRKQAWPLCCSRRTAHPMARLGRLPASAARAAAVAACLLCGVASAFSHGDVFVLAGSSTGRTHLVARLPFIRRYCRPCASWTATGRQAIQPPLFLPLPSRT